MTKEMVLIDTNVILRLFLADIKDQYEKAKLLFKQVEDGKLTAGLSILVINELIWIMESYYGQKRGKYLDKVLALLALKSVKIIDADKKTVSKTLKSMQKYELDFTDIYLWKLGGKVISFDKKLNKLL